MGEPQARLDCTLGEVTDNFDAARRPVKTAERVPGPFPYYGASGAIDSVEGYLFEGDYLLVAEDGENLRSRSTPIAFIAHGRFWANNHVHVLRGNDRADTRFLQYALSLTDISGYLTGSTQPKLTRSAMDSIRLQLPGIEDQRAIADVLTALDDKIAANVRLSEGAERLALALVESSGSPMPLGEVVKHRKSVVDPSALTSDRVAHYSLPAFDAGRTPEIVEPGTIKSAKFLVTSPSALVSKLNPRFPRIWDVATVPDRPALASTEFLVLEPRFSTSTLLWALLSQPTFGAALESKAAGTSGSHQRVSPEDVLSTPVPDPRAMSEILTDQVTALGLSAIQARVESGHLAATRDALLPALMSGRLRVCDAARHAGEAGL